MIPRSEDEARRACGDRGVRSLILARGEGGLIVRRLVVAGRCPASGDTGRAQCGRRRACDACTPKRRRSCGRGHPAVEISLGLAEIGRASRTRTPIDPATFAMIDDAAVKVAAVARSVPRARGPVAKRGRCGKAAKQAFLAAQRRDPRSLPAAYFLADHYFRAGDSLSGLQQTALLARLSPGGTAAVAPFVAAFAREPRALARDARDVPLATEHGGGGPGVAGAGSAQCRGPARARGFEPSQARQPVAGSDPDQAGREWRLCASAGACGRRSAGAGQGTWFSIAAFRSRCRRRRSIGR